VPGGRTSLLLGREAHWNGSPSVRRSPGHLAEIDAPDAVAAAVVGFLGAC